MHYTRPILAWFKQAHLSGMLTGIILLCATFVASLLCNSSWGTYYTSFLEYKGPFTLGFTADIYVNDGLMVLFFFLVGLEMKREWISGHLSKPGAAAFPAMCAVGGMIVPAGFFAFFNHHDPLLLHGWAIPTATDIAFALGALSLVGNRVPKSLKIFLLTLAIFDDMGAIVIIAIFYAHNLNYLALIAASVCMVTLLGLLHTKNKRLTPYMLLGFCLWLAFFTSGVHPTISGVLLALCIPMNHNLKNDSERCMLRDLEKSLHNWVSYGVLPIFAFVNAGVPLQDLSLSTVGLGIFLGLVIGKPLGIMTFAYFSNLFGLCKKPADAYWQHILGASFLCGIGFTMSLFISTLSYSSANLVNEARMGILAGSTVAAILGLFLLSKKLPARS